MLFVHGFCVKFVHLYILRLKFPFLGNLELLIYPHEGWEERLIMESPRLTGLVSMQMRDSNWFLAMESPTKVMCLLLMSWRKVLGSNLGSYAFL